MIPSFPNIERAKRTFRLVKLWGNIWAGIFFVGLIAIVPIGILFPNVDGTLVGVAILAGIIGYFVFAANIADLAQDLGRSYFAWFLSAFLVPPIGLLVAYYRVKYIAMEHGVYDSQKTGKTRQVGNSRVFEIEEIRNLAALTRKKWGAMNGNVKIALIIAVAMIICVGLWIYFSPYHSCVRAGDPPFLCAGGRWGPR